MDDSSAVCGESLEWVSYGACGHQEVCSTCVARLRFICADHRCCICKSKNRTSTTAQGSSTPRLKELPQSDCNGEGKVHSVAADYAEIIVIRHGETEWNAHKRVQGHLDVALNDVGRQQAAAVGDRLSTEPKISAVYSSDLKRALETAEIIARSCGGLEVLVCGGGRRTFGTVSLFALCSAMDYLQLKVIKDLDLRERHLGDLQGVVYHEMAKVYPKAYQALSSHRTDQEIPGGGESFDQVYQRCTSSLQKIGRKHKGERVVVVTHGGVIEALYMRATSSGRTVGKIPNTSLNVFHLSDGDIWTIKVRGDVSHLNTT